jgi:N-acetyl-anhydromuramyl-L-alanine amidase AmpD
MSYETDAWPFVKARHFTSLKGKPPRKIRLVVIHDMEFPEKLAAAEDVARYFSATPTKASAHICVDADSIVQCVYDRDVAYAAPGANNDGIQVELAGYARQTRAEWLDEYGRRMLDRAARAVAQYCRKFSIPAVHLTNDQLRAGKAGIIGHAQASAVYRKSDHMDPGTSFPWDYFLDRVHAHALKLGA